MPAENVSLKIEATVVERLTKALGIANSKDNATICQKIVELAFKEWDQWLSGSRRFLSLTEQTIERVADIYDTLLPNERPTPSELGHRMSIPYGQAVYACRVLGDRKFSRWREEGLRELKGEIKRRQPEAQQLLKSKANETQPVALSLSLWAYRELTRCFDELRRKDSSIEPPVRHYSEAGWLKISVTALTFKALANHPDIDIT
jgi:hypothetical protein